jgi:hypothetical protein
MAKLTYAAIASLDGYVEDEEGRFDWAVPDEEGHAFVNDLEPPLGASSARTRTEREFDPDAVRQLNIGAGLVDIRLTGPAMRRQAKIRTRVNRC